MKAVIRVGITVATLSLALAVLTLGQEPMPLSVNVDQVTADVYVDFEGKPVTTLTREDFSIFEDGVPRQITGFAAAENPYNVLLLFDRSSSTQDQRRFLIRAVSRFVGQLREQDRVALAAFDDKPEMLVDWTSPRTFTRTFDIPNANGGTDVYRAIEWALGRFRGLKGRKGIIVLTDGVDNRLSGSLVKFDKDRVPRIAPPDADGDFKKMLRVVAQGGAPIYFVAVNTDLNPDPKADAGSFNLLQRAAGRLRMELTANQSGGLMHLPENIDDVVEHYGTIGRTLGHSYTLLFSPAKVRHDGAAHRIEIRVRDKTMNVTQLRDEYYDQ
jgi:VWFA-related protein